MMFLLAVSVAFGMSRSQCERDAGPLQEFLLEYCTQEGVSLGTGWRYAECRSAWDQLQELDNIFSKTLSDRGPCYGKLPISYEIVEKLSRVPGNLRRYEGLQQQLELQNASPMPAGADAWEMAPAAIAGAARQSVCYVNSTFSASSLSIDPGETVKTAIRSKDPLAMILGCSEWDELIRRSEVAQVESPAEEDLRIERRKNWQELCVGTVQGRPQGTYHLDAYGQRIRAAGALGQAEDCIDNARDQIAVARFNNDLVNARALAFYYALTLDPVIDRLVDLPMPIREQASIDLWKPGMFRNILQELAKPDSLEGAADASLERARGFRDAIFKRAWPQALDLLYQEIWYVSHTEPGNRERSFYFYSNPSDPFHFKKLEWGGAKETVRDAGTPGLENVQIVNRQYDSGWDGISVAAAGTGLVHARMADVRFAGCVAPPTGSPTENEGLRSRLNEVEAAIACLQEGFLVLYPEGGGPPAAGGPDRLGSTLEMTFRAEWEHLNQLQGEAVELREAVAAHERAIAEAERAREAAAANSPETRCRVAQVEAFRLNQAMGAIERAIANERVIGEAYGVVDLQRLYELAQRHIRIQEALDANSVVQSGTCAPSPWY